MLREIADALETLTAVRPLVLVFEDLHWSDRSTLELIAYLAQRRRQARLLVIGTYRPTSVVLSGHPLKGVKQELHSRGLCEDLAVELLAPAAVEAYLAARLGSGALGNDLTGVIHRRTEGHPLFMVNVIDYCLLRGSLHETDGVWTLRPGDDAAVPDGVRQMIDKQIELLEERTRRLLEVASVAGGDFAAATVAFAAGCDPEEAEEVFEELALRGHLLREGGLAEWPDGTVSGRYAFRHALYQNVLYDRLAEARRVRLHRVIGEREEAAHGAETRRVAAALAMHFERGRDLMRAVKYLEQAGESADRRSAYHEAIKHFAHAIDVLRTLPETPARTRQELALQLGLGGPLMLTKFFAAPEMEAVCARAQQVVDASSDSPDLAPALQFLRGFHFMRAELTAARALADRLLAIAERTRDPFTLLWARYSLGETLLFMGEPAAALIHLEHGVALRDSQPAGWRAVHVHHPAVACLAHAGLALWLLGRPDRGLERMHEAIALARQMAHPLSLAFALGMAGVSHLARDEAEAAAECADEGLDLAKAHGLRYWLAMATGTRGLALDLSGAREGMQVAAQGNADYLATGARINGTFGAMFVARSSLRRGGSSPDLGLALLREALVTVERTGERLWEAELYRLRGELLRRSLDGKDRKTASEAEDSLLHALEIARRQEARILELRATMSLSTLWRRRGKRRAARALLSDVYGSFGEGFETPDLRHARTLLAELA
jgi:tetratricopeptide (TPR) repeat protein